MEVNVLVTEDLYLAAYALACGGEIVSLEVRQMNGRRLAVFAIDGDLGDAERSYWRGEATVELQLLKVHLRRLKDRAFDAVRGEERRHAFPEAGRPHEALAGGFHRRPRR